jgi:hypothetical protein
MAEGSLVDGPQRTARRTARAVDIHRGLADVRMRDNPDQFHYMEAKYNVKPPSAKIPNLVLF